MKEKLVNAVVDIFKVKTQITLMTVGTACYMTLTDRLDTAVFVSIVTAVITYYFGKPSAKDGAEK